MRRDGVAGGWMREECSSDCWLLLCHSCTGLFVSIAFIDENRNLLYVLIQGCDPACGRLLFKEEAQAHVEDGTSTFRGNVGE